MDALYTKSDMAAPPPIEATDPETAPAPEPAPLPEEVTSKSSLSINAPKAPEADIAVQNDAKLEKSTRRPVQRTTPPRHSPGAAKAKKADGEKTTQPAKTPTARSKEKKPARKRAAVSRSQPPARLGSARARSNSELKTPRKRVVSAAKGKQTAADPKRPRTVRRAQPVAAKRVQQPAPRPRPRKPMTAPDRLAAIVTGQSTRFVAEILAELRRGLADEVVAFIEASPEIA